jgi:hypothetical protein
MSDHQVSDVLAQAFAAEGADILFTLMGDANMYWSAAMADNQKTRLVHARHEHCAVAMAGGYARATGKIGVASVTCGPGYTQIMTALTMRATAAATSGGGPGFELRGAKINTPGRLEGLFREHRQSAGTALWDVHIDDLIPSRQYRRVHSGEA